MTYHYTNKNIIQKIFSGEFSPARRVARLSPAQWGPAWPSPASCTCIYFSTVKTAAAPPVRPESERTVWSVVRRQEGKMIERPGIMWARWLRPATWLANMFGEEWGDIWIVQLPCELRLRLNHSTEMGEVCIIKRNVSSELYIYLHFRRINSFTVFSAEPYRYLFIYRAKR